MVYPNLILVAGLSVIIGLGTGIASGYIGLNPQVNYLTGQIEDRDSAIGDLSLQLEERDGAMISDLEDDQRMEQALELMAQELEAKEIEIISLQNAISTREVELNVLQAQLVELEMVPDVSEDVILLQNQIQNLEEELTNVQLDLEALQVADVHVIGPFITQVVNPDGPDEHIIRGWIVNYGDAATRYANFEFEFREGGCLCQSRIVETVKITLGSIQGKSFLEFNKSFFFDLDQDIGKIVTTDFNWG